MKKQILTLGKALKKAEQTQINGGSSGPCQIYQSGIGWTSGWSVEDAQYLYHNEGDVTGYCCASC